MIKALDKPAGLWTDKSGGGNWILIGKLWLLFILNELLKEMMKFSNIWVGCIKKMGFLRAFRDANSSTEQGGLPASMFI